MPTKALVSENIWNLRVRLEKSLRKSTRRLSQKAGEEKEIDMITDI